MRLEDVKIPLRDVKDYPELFVREPSLTELTELALKFKKYDPSKKDNKSSEATLWFFESFVRSEDGNKFEDLKVDNVHKIVTSGMMLACINAVKGDQPGMDEVPQE